MLTRWNFGAFDGGIDGDEKQDGSQPRDRRRIELADRALCRADTRLFLVSIRTANGFGVHGARGCGDDCRCPFDFSNQR